MFTSKIEENFFLSHIKFEHRVLEYGSGASTVEISKLCKEIVSIEHQYNWYKKIQQIAPKNLTYFLFPPNLDYVEGESCGTLEEFFDYVNSPLPYGPFDIILIDGRARVACASVAKLMSHNNTLVFIHDYDRPEYAEALNYLRLIEQVGTMAKFQIKHNL